MIGSFNTPVYAQKILPLDNWQYDDGSQIFNETSMETSQILTSGGEAIAVSKISTLRPVESDYHYTKTINGGPVMNVTVSITMTEILQFIFITQSGGFPMFSYSTFSGTAYIDIESPEGGLVHTENTFSNIVSEDSFIGNPSLALTTAESQTFGIYRTLGNTAGDHLEFNRKYVISTDQSASDTIRNYTVTPVQIDLRLTLGVNKFQFTKTSTSTEFYAQSGGEIADLSRVASLPEAQLYQYDASNRLPILIKQTESAKIGALGLNDFEETDNPTKVVEYQLVQEEEETSSKDDSPFPAVWLVSLMLIPVLRSKLRAKYI